MLLSLAICVVLMVFEVKYWILEVIGGLANGSSLAGGHNVQQLVETLLLNPGVISRNLN